MAFNFNWSPLSTDAGFLPRAQELLTNALNRADPKPAIIVDDIIVNELNLGDVPPELEILEIGDLAEDRFRGTFKMMYRGNAFLTLKTKVQANPLNTFLGTRSPFAAPQPLAADTGLTIPLQITLSEFRLSGFIILVFSRQKGLTLVFRNDPLESLRVSSTFDSIPFVANFLQKEIENQLRGLLMDELPAIIHRLSLRLWVPDHETREERDLNTTNKTNDEVVIDPLASPPQDPVDSTGAVLTPSEIAALSLDSSLETQSLFSQKNLIRLATLTDSNRTLSLFTPTIREAVFRACTGPLERGEMTGLHSRSATPALSRTHSYAASLSAATTSTFDTSPQSRPGLSSFQSANGGLSMGGSRHGQGHRPRKRKKRVVNLRRQPETGEMELISEDGSTADTASVADSTSAPRSVLSAPAATTASDPTRSLNPVTPPQSPAATRHNLSLNDDHMRGARSVSQNGTASTSLAEEAAADIHKTPRAFHRDATIRVRSRKPPAMTLDDDPTPRGSMLLPEHTESSGQMASQKAIGSCDKSSIESEGEGGSSRAPIPNFFQFVTDPSNGSSIAERAWMMKMASEMAKRYEEERSKGSFGPFSPSADERHPPPAYAR